jgi:hypothetical protein
MHSTDLEKKDINFLTKPDKRSVVRKYDKREEKITLQAPFDFQFVTLLIMKLLQAW